MTALRLAALPLGTQVRDRMGDIGTIRDGWIEYPETSPQTFERAQKKYGPFAVVTEPRVLAAGHIPDVHWVGDAPTSLHGNGAASFQRTTRNPADVTCKLCRSLLAREAMGSRGSR